MEISTGPVERNIYLPETIDPNSSRHQPRRFPEIIVRKSPHRAAPRREIADDEG